MATLYYLPIQEFQRITSLEVPATQRTALFADLARINTLYAIARAGSGHIGTSFSSVDIVSWLYLNELRLPRGYDPAEPVDRYFSSKGHDVPALYSILIGLGLLPFEKLHGLRRLGGLPGHPDVGTPHVEANTGSLGMGISKAKGMVLANRLIGPPGNVYVLTGDGELQEGQFWESLVSAANHGIGEITAIIDHNKVQSDILVKDTSDLGDLEAKLRAFGWHVARCDGHDMEALAAIFEEFRGVQDRPKILIADTIKGKGVSFMEHPQMEPGGLYKFHSGAPDDATYEKAARELIDRVNGQLAALGEAELRLETAERPPRPAPESPQKLVAAYGEALVCQAEQNERIVAFDADLVLDTGLIPFKQRFPERFVECGIAEMDMVSQAGGAALRGLMPVVHSFACFLSPRPNEQFYNNATERTKVMYVGSLAGLLPGGPGHSHQCVRDISALGGIPGLVLVEPCNEAEVAHAVEFCLNGTSESTYLRLVSIPCEVPFQLPAGYRMELGRGVTLREGTDALLIGYGPVLLPQAYQAAELLAEREGISLQVVNLPWLNRVDREWFRETVAPFGHVFTLDNHYVHGGQGDMLLRELAEAGLAGQVQAHRLGVTEIPACGQNPEVLQAHRLDAASLAQEIAAHIR